MPVVIWPHNSKVMYLGRSGWADCLGIDISYSEGHRLVQLQVINRRGIGRCHIDVPFENLEELIHALEKTRDEIKSKGRC